MGIMTVAAREEAGQRKETQNRVKITNPEVVALLLIFLLAWTPTEEPPL
jgi:hypothetical protein